MWHVFPASVVTRSPLRRQIALAIGLKLIALAVLWFAFFGPEHRPLVTPATLEKQLFDSARPAPSGV